MLRVEEFPFTLRRAVAVGDKGSGRNAFYPPSLEFWFPFYLSLCPSARLCIFFPCLFSLPSPQEQRIMLFRFAYTFRPFLPHTHTHTHTNIHTHSRQYRYTPTFRHCFTDFSPRFDTSGNSCKFDLTSSRPRSDSLGDRYFFIIFREREGSIGKCDARLVHATDNWLAIASRNIPR